MSNSFNYVWHSCQEQKPQAPCQEQLCGFSGILLYCGDSKLTSVDDIIHAHFQIGDSDLPFMKVCIIYHTGTVSRLILILLGLF